MYKEKLQNHLFPPVFAPVAALPRSLWLLPTQPPPPHFNWTVPFSNYRVLECDLKGCIASTGKAGQIKTRRADMARTKKRMKMTCFGTMDLCRSKERSRQALSCDDSIRTVRRNSSWVIFIQSWPFALVLDDFCRKKLVCFYARLQKIFFGFTFCFFWFPTNILTVCRVEIFRT